MKTPLVNKQCITGFIFSIVATLCISVTQGQGRKSVAPKRTKEATVKIYTTALNTSYRLSKVGEIGFTDTGAMVERKVFVFVDDTRSFQTMLGIGGAITDA